MSTRGLSPGNKVIAFASGQMWAVCDEGQGIGYHAVILKTERRADEQIIHVAILRNSGEVEIGHLPITPDAMRRSAVILERQNVPLPPFQVAYEIWREEYDSQRAGIYTVSLAECLMM